MRRFAWLFVVALVLGPCLAFAVSEVQLGEVNAHYYGNGVISVPLLCTNDFKLRDWEVAFRVTAPSTLIADSVTAAGRWTDPGGVILSILVHPDGNDAAGRPFDSGAVLVARWQSGGIQPGTGPICNLWFSGAQVGDVITFEIVDTMHVTKPGLEMATILVGTDLSPRFPSYRTSNLTVAPAFFVSVPPTVQGYTLREIRIPISTSGLVPGNLDVLSFVGPEGDLPLPEIVGSGPWELVWTPALHGGGAYLLDVRLSNSYGQTEERSIAISVIPSTLTGDIDCDGKVDLTDLSRIINWLINRTLPPVCP